MTFQWVAIQNQEQSVEITLENPSQDLIHFFQELLYSLSFYHEDFFDPFSEQINLFINQSSQLQSAKEILWMSLEEFIEIQEAEIMNQKLRLHFFQKLFENFPINQKTHPLPFPKKLYSHPQAKTKRLLSVKHYPSEKEFFELCFQKSKEFLSRKIPYLICPSSFLLKEVQTERGYATSTQLWDSIFEKRKKLRLKKNQEGCWQC